ncbi:MAG: hypothetical protein WD830_02315 [Chloroflexota bacterium]
MPGDFSDHQWQRLVEAGPQIALAVAASSGSRGQSEAELDAFLRLVDESADEAEEAGLLGRLAADTRSKLAAGMLRGDSEDAIPTGIHAAREAGAILAVQADEHEARVLRQWLLQVAHTVAGAARDGGVLGLGGQDVSKVERETMAEIADGLGASGEPDAEAAMPAEDPGEAEPGGALRDASEVGPDGQPIGEDNIRDGTVRGTMGGPNQTQGEGQGG